MPRRRKLVLVALAVPVFLLVSALLARALSVDGAERSAVTELIQAQARGDAAGMLSRMEGCTAAPCRDTVAADARTLARPGRVYILQLSPSAGFSLTSTLGVARVAWKTPSSLPIVQCVRVRRAGDVLGGFRVELLAIGRRIATDGVCPQ